MEDNRDIVLGAVDNPPQKKNTHTTFATKSYRCLSHMLALRDSSFIINTLLLLILEPFSPLHHSLSSCLLVQLGLSVCLLEPLAIFWPKLQLSEIPVSAIHFCQNSQQSNCSIVEMRCCQGAHSSTTSPLANPSLGQYGQTIPLKDSFWFRVAALKQRYNTAL